MTPPRRASFSRWRNKTKHANRTLMYTCAGYVGWFGCLCRHPAIYGPCVLVQSLGARNQPSGTDSVATLLATTGKFTFRNAM